MKHSENFIGKRLAYHRHFVEIENDRSKLFEICNNPPCLRPGNVDAPQSVELDLHFSFVEAIISRFIRIGMIISYRRYLLPLVYF